MARIAISYQFENVFIAGDGTPHNTSRIGERRNGVVVSTPVMSDQEIEEAKLPAWVKRGDADANRLYGGKVVQ